MTDENDKKPRTWYEASCVVSFIKIRSVKQNFIHRYEFIPFL